jgi:hypothetical protein
MLDGLVEIINLFLWIVLGFSVVFFFVAAKNYLNKK